LTKWRAGASSTPTTASNFSPKRRGFTTAAPTTTAYIVPKRGAYTVDAAVFVAAGYKQRTWRACNAAAILI